MKVDTITDSSEEFGSSAKKKKKSMSPTWIYHVIENEKSKKGSDSYSTMNKSQLDKDPYQSYKPNKSIKNGQIPGRMPAINKSQNMEQMQMMGPTMGNKGIPILSHHPGEFGQDMGMGQREMRARDGQGMVPQIQMESKSLISDI
jgi:hypothetical protein